MTLKTTIKGIFERKGASLFPPAFNIVPNVQQNLRNKPLTNRKSHPRFFLEEKTNHYTWCCFLFLVSLFFGLGGCIKHSVEIEDRKAAIHHNDRFYDLAAIDKDRIWVVGFYGKIIHSADGGQTWGIQESGTMDPLTGVSFVNPSKGWVTTLKGEILHTADGGETWLPQESGAEDALMGVDFFDENYGWAVGAYNTILRTENGGNNWVRCSVPEENIEDATGLFIETGESILNAVSFDGPKNGWVVGEYGTAYSTNDGGMTWTKKNTGIPVGNYLFDVCFPTPENGWIVAIGGRIFTTTDGGGSWIQSSSPTSNALYGIGSANGQIWATGTRGAVIIYNDKGWNNYVNPLPSFSWFRSIEFLDDDHGWIVGGTGTVLKTTNGGKQWMAMK